MMLSFMHHEWMSVAVDQTAIEDNMRPVPTDDWPEEKTPSALSVLWRHRELIYSLTQRDIRSRYKQSVLGIAWALLQPLAMTAVFTVFMSMIDKSPSGPIPRPVSIYIGMLPWTFFAGGLTGGTECLVGNFNLITKIYFPREVFPISAVLGKIIDLGLGVLVLIAMLALFHVRLSGWILFTIPVLLVQIALMLGLTFMLSSANLFYRDVRHIMPLLTQIWMYVSPIVYNLDRVPHKYLRLYMLNPMAGMVDAYRRVALEGVPPIWNYLGYSAVFSIVVLLLGYWMFKKLEPKFAEII